MPNRICTPSGKALGLCKSSGISPTLLLLHGRQMSLSLVLSISILFNREFDDLEGRASIIKEQQIGQPRLVSWKLWAQEAARRESFPSARLLRNDKTRDVNEPRLGSKARKLGSSFARLDKLNVQARARSSLSLRKFDGFFRLQMQNLSNSKSPAA